MRDREALLDEIREWGLRAATEGRLGAAIELLHEYLKHRPADGAVWVRFGDTVREIGLKDEAERALLKALDLVPIERRGWVCIRLALLHHEAGRYGQAEEFSGGRVRTQSLGGTGRRGLCVGQIWRR